MPTDILERLKALVVELHAEVIGEQRACCEETLRSVGNRLAAVLAESERERRGCICHYGSVCNEACAAGKHHDGCIYAFLSKPKPTLPLGHEFVPAVDVLGRASKSSSEFCGQCYEPREAHEPKP